MTKTILSLFVLTLAIAACGSGDSAVECDNGDTCLEPNMCIPGGGCTAPEPEGFCETSPDGELCDPGPDAEPGDGECQSGECVALICGDGEAKGNETCDGNIGADSCTGAGFDYGTPRCGDDCRSDNPSRCGNIGWTEVSPGSELTNRALYAVGDEIWLGADEGFFYFDGRAWIADATMKAIALHGTSRTNVWGVFKQEDGEPNVARRFDGTIWGEPLPIPGVQALSILAVSEDEIYAAGSSDNGATVSRWDGSSWSTDHQDPDGIYFSRLFRVGETVVASGLSGGLALITRNAGVWSTRRFPGYIGINGAWGETINDFYLSLSGITGGFNPSGFTHTMHVSMAGEEVISERAGPLVALGDSLFSLSPVRTPQIKFAETGTPVRLIGAPGIQALPGNAGESFVAAVVAGNRIVAATGHGVHTFYGAGYGEVSPGAPVSITSRAGADLTLVRTPVAGRAQVEIISDAFGDESETSNFTINNSVVRALWAVTGGGGFFAFDFSGGSGIRSYEADGTISPQTPTDQVIRAMDGNDEGTLGLAVGDSGEVYIFDGTTWTKEVFFGTTNLRAVRESGGSFLVAGDAGNVYLRATDGSWSALDTGTTANLTAIDGTPTAFRAAGNDGAIVTCVNATCTTETIAGAPNFSDISIVSTSDIFAVAGSKSFHFDGLRWSEMSNGKNISHVVATADIVWLGNGFESDFYTERIERAVSWEAAP